MQKLIKIGGFLLALLIFGLIRADDGTELIYTHQAFKKAISGDFAIAFVYELSNEDRQKVELPDGTRDYPPIWHVINRVDELISQLSNEGRYGEVATFIRVNLTRGDLHLVGKRYNIIAPSILLFVDGRLIGKPFPVGQDFKLSLLKKTSAWRKFNDFVEQRLIDLDKAARAKARRERDRRRIYDSYDYFYGPRPYLSLGWGGGYYGPGWGSWGWNGPAYVGFGVTI